MARNENSKRGGAKSLADQITDLENSVGEEGVRKAKGMVEKIDGDIIRLAFKYGSIDKRTTGSGLGQRLEALITSGMPKNQQDQVRALLIGAKAKLAQEKKAATA